MSAFVPVAVGIDESSLDDPMLVPKKALQVVVPRPGVTADVEIGLVGGGDIEGAVVKSGGLGFEGLGLELVDASGKVVSTALSDFDGFFLFERVPYGVYSVRVAKASATAAKIEADLNLRAVVTADKAIVRLGAVHVTSDARDCSRRRASPSLRPACSGAVEKTRTSTAFRPQRPQRCASTSSATTARHEMSGRTRMGGRHWQGGASSKAT